MISLSYLASILLSSARNRFLDVIIYLGVLIWIRCSWSLGLLSQDYLSLRLTRVFTNFSGLSITTLIFLMRFLWLVLFIFFLWVVGLLFIYLPLILNVPIFLFSSTICFSTSILIFLIDERESGRGRHWKTIFELTPFGMNPLIVFLNAKLCR